MSLGLYLGSEPATRGFLRRSRPVPLERALDLVSSRHGKLLANAWQDGAAVAFVLHPLAEAVTLTDEGGAVTLEAMTSSVGPGYHAFVCDLARELADELATPWAEDDEEYGDETEFFEHGDFGRLQEEMLAWLGSLAAAVLEQVEPDSSELAVAMPLGDRFVNLDFANTPLGPRSREWFEAVARDASRGIDFFAWWERGLGASYLAGRALAELWNRIPWRPPLDEDEERLMRETLELLRAAHEAEPDRPLPWAAWVELARLVDDAVPTDVTEAAERDESPPIGYRRHDVVAALPGGWSVRVPGSLAAGVDEEGAWVAHDVSRSVYASVLSTGGQPVDLSDLEPEEGEEHAHDDEGARRRAWAAVEQEAEGPELVLRGVAASGDSVATITITCEPADEQWALGVWRSLRRADAD